MLCLAVAAHAFHEEFGADWESRWAHSSDDKYSGKFVRAAPKGLSDEGLKVRRAHILGAIGALIRPLPMLKTRLLIPGAREGQALWHRHRAGHAH